MSRSVVKQKSYEFALQTILYALSLKTINIMKYPASFCGPVRASAPMLKKHWRAIVKKIFLPKCVLLPKKPEKQIIGCGL
jgi:hypothetical protein